MRKQTIATIIVAALLGITMFTVKHTQTLNNAIKIKQIELKDNAAKLQLLDDKYQKLNDNLNKAGTDKQKLEKDLEDLQKERDKLKQDLKAKLDAKQKDIATRAENALGAPQTAYAATGNFYKDYIYSHESGNCPTKWQGQTSCPSGYTQLYDPSTQGIGYGLCQSTPAIKMASAGADWQTSYATQDKWCTDYMLSRYGSWEAAYNHWLTYRSW